MFGDVLLGINPVTSSDPRSLKDLLLLRYTPVRSCFIIVESTKLKEELLTKSSSTVYQELLKTANEIVGKNISSHYSLHPSLNRDSGKGQGASRFPCLNLKTICFKPILLVVHASSLDKNNEIKLITKCSEALFENCSSVLFFFFFKKCI